MISGTVDCCEFICVIFFIALFMLLKKNVGICLKSVTIKFHLHRKSTILKRRVVRVNECDADIYIMHVKSGFSLTEENTMHAFSIQTVMCI